MENFKIPAGWVLGLSLLLASPLLGAEPQTMFVAGPDSSSATVLLIGGLSGKDESVRIVEREVRSFEAIRQNRRSFQLIAIPLANPDAANAQSDALWRWIGIHAPDLILVVGNENVGLTEALSRNSVTRQIPIQRVGTIGSKDSILQLVPKDIAPSEAHREIERRLGRNAREVAAELAQVYGHNFNEALALIGQIRLGRTTDVERLAAPYVNTVTNPLANLVFAELAERTGNPRYLELVRNAIDNGLTQNGEADDPMVVPLLVKAGKLTGNTKYFDMAVRQFAHTTTRPDDPYPALALMLALSDVRLDQPQFSPLLHAFRDYMAAVARTQDEDGLWREALEPGTYSEFSATAMIATAMLRGVNNGWLDWDDFQPLVDKAWRAILARTAADGRVLDGSAIADRDPLGGAVALMFALEMAGL